LRHHAVAVTDARMRELLSLLDGSLDRFDLAERMRCSAGQLDAQLNSLGRHAMLLG
jgi:hypothetical protein